MIAWRRLNITVDRDPPKGTDVGAHHTSLMEAGQKVRKIRAIGIGHLSHHLIAETPSMLLEWPCFKLNLNIHIDCLHWKPI